MRMFTVNKFIYYLFEVKNRCVLPPHLQCVSIKNASDFEIFEL